MSLRLNEELIPEGLRDIYQQVYTSEGLVEDERVKLALFAVMRAVHKDVTGETLPLSRDPNVVEFVRPEPHSAEPGLAKSR